MTEEETVEYLTDVRETLESMEGDRQGVLEYMMELGDELDPLEPGRRTAENLVPGCVSQVHIDADLDHDHRLVFHGSSQSLIVKGFVYVLCDAFTGWSPRAFVDLAASSYASRRDRRLFPHRCRMARDLQRHYLALVRAVSRHDGVDEAALLQELAARTAILDPPARMTGDGIDHASALLQRHRRRLSPEQLYRVVERFASEHHLEPDTDERPPPLRGAEPRRLLERMLDIVEEYRESL